MPVTRDTFDSYMPRLGYLPQDQNMDEGAKLCIFCEMFYQLLYICIFVHIFVYICTLYTCITTYSYICIFAYLFISIFVYLYICIFVYLYICIYMNTWIFAYLYICIFVYLYQPNYRRQGSLYPQARPPVSLLTAQKHVCHQSTVKFMYMLVFFMHIFSLFMEEICCLKPTQNFRNSNRSP